MNNELDMTFGGLRKYLSRIDRYSIYTPETGKYKNYVFLKRFRMIMTICSFTE